MQHDTSRCDHVKTLPLSPLFAPSRPPGCGTREWWHRPATGGERSEGSGAPPAQLGRLQRQPSEDPGALSAGPPSATARPTTSRDSPSSKPANKRPPLQSTMTKPGRPNHAAPASRATTEVVLGARSKHGRGPARSAWEPPPTAHSSAPAARAPPGGGRPRPHPDRWPGPASRHGWPSRPAPRAYRPIPRSPSRRSSSRVRLSPLQLPPQSVVPLLSPVFSLPLLPSPHYSFPTIDPHPVSLPTPPIPIPLSSFRFLCS